ncbi:gamma-secretase subunit Aph-1 [Halteromyces radiatus]|uniref:gamma-secretase subunit Aph-1 n=1 Tax=Halteromyces radiatus TaxID=101107 RepID=UPI00221FF067|nr:gamma-secretase subunit Aph-1 [Halteromyces radiatus]KAI8098489.1 gamma-secretase subunit Aph-1 [Halteromyces radiatus]
MSLYTFFGCLLIAYGPILSIFFLYIAQSAQHVLVTVASAFFCLIALLFSSVIWYLAKTVQSTLTISIVYSVAIQEIFRWCYFLLLQRSEAGLNMITRHPTSPYNKLEFGFVAGYGYALATSLISYISILVESIGPGVIMCPSCPNASLFLISAVTTTLFSLLHMAWMTVAFDGYSKRSWSGYGKVAWVILSHFGASYATLMNTSTTIAYGCVYAVVMELIILLISCVLIGHSLKLKLSVPTASHQHSS